MFKNTISVIQTFDNILLIKYRLILAIIVKIFNKNK